MANLLQVSSPFGRAMETVDRASDSYLGNIIAASAEGYAFPTNLDRDQPIGGIAPQTQADLVRQAVAEEWTQEAFESALDAQAAHPPKPRVNHHRAATSPHVDSRPAP
jgi:hypothetical protein